MHARKEGKEVGKRRKEGRKGRRKGKNIGEREKINEKYNPESESNITTRKYHVTPQSYSTSRISLRL